MTQGRKNKSKQDSNGQSKPSQPSPHSNSESSPQLGPDLKSHDTPISEKSITPPTSPIQSKISDKKDGPQSKSPGKKISDRAVTFSEENDLEVWVIEDFIFLALFDD